MKEETKIEVGMYIRDKKGVIDKITSKSQLCKEELGVEGIWTDSLHIAYVKVEDLRASHKLIDLIEYMDLLEIENPIKLYDRDIEVSLFNPVRCDGFTTFEDGTRCIILNLDYIVDVNKLNIKSIVTKEQFESCKYEVEK